MQYFESFHITPPPPLHPGDGLCYEGVWLEPGGSIQACQTEADLCETQPGLHAAVDYVPGNTGCQVGSLEGVLVVHGFAEYVSFTEKG